MCLKIEEKNNLIIKKNDLIYLVKMPKSNYDQYYHNDFYYPKNKINKTTINNCYVGRISRYNKKYNCNHVHIGILPGDYTKRIEYLEKVAYYVLMNGK